MKDRFKQFWMGRAEHSASMSRGVRAKVGAVIVKGDNEISTSWNGTPRGADNKCEYVTEDGDLVTKPDVIHAELNAIYKLARSHESSLGADMFVTHAPCLPCALAIIQSGIKKVYYKYEYRAANGEGLGYLRAHNVEVEKLGEPDTGGDRLLPVQPHDMPAPGE